MINIMYAVDPIKRIAKPMSGHAVTEQDHEASSLRFAFPDNIAGTGLDSTGTAVRVMYIRPDGGDPVAKTLTFYKHSGGYYLYDWNLQKSDLQKEGHLVFSLCILDISSGEVEEWHTTPCAVRVLSTIHTDDSDEGDDTITPTVKERVAVLESMIQRVASGAPIVVASTSAMTDTAQIYVLSTDGNWYYHNGSTWVAGGVYGAVATDTTLTQAGIPADAKVVGDELSDLKSALDSYDNIVHKNLLNQSAATVGKYWSGNTSYTNSDYCYTELIEVTVGKTYYLFDSNLFRPVLPMRFVTFFNSAKQYNGTEYEQKVSFAVPEESAYVRISFKLTDISNLMLTDIENPAEFLPYGEYKAVLENEFDELKNGVSYSDTTNKTEDITSKITWTSGYIGNNGASGTTPTLHYSQRIPVKEGTLYQDLVLTLSGL